MRGNVANKHRLLQTLALAERDQLAGLLRKLLLGLPAHGLANDIDAPSLSPEQQRCSIDAV